MDSGTSKKVEKMKEHIGQMVGGNFYTYNLYKYTDGKGLVLFIAEPKGIGVTRSAKSIEELRAIVNLDADRINCILHHSRTK